MAKVINLDEKRRTILAEEGKPLTDEEFEEFRRIFTDTIVTLADFADKHNIDRNDFIRYFAAMFKTTADISSFYQFESQERSE